MAEQVAQQSLIRTTYFLSPEYMSAVSSGWSGPDETLHFNEVHHDDDRDTFRDWWCKNTLGNKFMGENGVWCEIDFTPVYDRKSRKQIGDTKKPKTGYRSWIYEEPYRKVLKVKSMPSSKEIPSELLEDLTEMGYCELNPKDGFVKRSFGVKV